MADFLIHGLYATFLQNLPTYLLSLLISYVVLKQIFKSREVKPLIQNVLFFVGSVIMFWVFLSL
jgi:hypothetical protein